MHASTKQNLLISKDIIKYLQPRPFHLNLAERCLQLLDLLDKLAGETDANGGWTEKGAALYRTYFVGRSAWFSSEDTDDDFVFSFPDPSGPGKIQCPWHGKTKMRGQFRIHFEWPRPVGQKVVKVVYIGMKLTKQ